MTTKRCTKCQLVKSVTEFNKNNATKDRLYHHCKDCARKNLDKHTKLGLEMLQNFALQAGQCKLCSRNFTIDDWHLFDLDHIDPNQKLHKRETSPIWVALHQQEFELRVKSNIQLLCIKCHRNKTTEESKRGGSVHQKIHGQSEPSEVIDFGWNLFNPVPTPEADDYVSWAWSQVRREGDWIVERDIDGRIIYSQLAK